MIENPWLKLAENRIDKLIRRCKEESVRGSYEGAIDLNEVSYLLNGSKVEIQKLMVENHLLKMKLIDKNVV